MSEVQSQEKDYFWAYIIIGVLVFAATMFTVKTMGGSDYNRAAELIEENPSNSAYKN